jgi:peroxiredoxin
MNQQLLKILFMLLCCLTFSAQAQGVLTQKDEPAPGEIEHKLVKLKKVNLSFRDFTYALPDGQKVNLREMAKGKKAVLIVYFAAWCDNSAHDSATLNALWQQYRDKGLTIIGVCNYSSHEELKEFISKNQVAYPVCLESEAKTEDESVARRDKTAHYAYRKASGDERKWGTPFSVLMATGDFKSEGEFITDKMHTAHGELKLDDAEKLIRKHLNLK